MNANKILFRCSSLGHIMTEPKGKSNLEKYNEAETTLARYKSDYSLMANKETKTAAKKLEQINKQAAIILALEPVKGDVLLSDSCKTHLVDLYVRNKYDRFSEIHSRFLDKGNDVEEDSITVVARITKQMLKKNEAYICNEYIEGHPDLFIGESITKAERVRDTKSSWDIFSYHRAISKELDEKYYWQGMGYMALTGAKICNIDYCLNNTPYHLVNRDLLMESYKHEDGNTPAWVELQIIANHVYDKKTFAEYMNIRGLHADDENAKAIIEGFVEVPLAERHFSFEYEYSQSDVDRLYQRIIDCRAYMNTHLFKQAHEPSLIMAEHDKEEDVVIVSKA